MCTSFVGGPLLATRVEHAWARASSSAQSIARFEEVALGSARAVGDAIRSGRASFKDLLAVLEERKRFREWLADQPFDADIVAEYITAISRDTWMDKLPAKTVRFAVASGAGLAAEVIAPSGLGAAAGLSVGALDALVLDRYLKGWRPNQFVNDLRESIVDKNSRN